MATIVWEELEQEGIGWVARRNVYRSKVPGGWLVRVQSADTDLSLFFRTLSTGGCKQCRVRPTHQEKSGTGLRPVITGWKPVPPKNGGQCPLYIKTGGHGGPPHRKPKTKS